MFRYPDGTFKRTLPTFILVDNVRLSTKGWTMDQWNEKGYNEAIELRKDSDYTYDTQWVKDGIVYREENVTDPVFREAELFPVWKDNKQTEIKDGADTALAEPAARFSMREQVSWAQQAYEAREWEADNTFVTPMIDGIISVTKEDKAAFCANVIANETEWSQIAGPVFGQRQVYTDQLNAATTCADIKAIDVVYGS